MIRCRLVYVARGGGYSTEFHTGEALPRGPIPYPTFYIPGLLAADRVPLSYTSY